MFGGVYCTLGWSDFEEKIMLHILCCAKLLLDPNSKISCLNVASFLGRRASKNFDCCPKISKFFQGCDRWGTFSSIYLKAKNEEKFKKYLFLPCTDKKQFCPLKNKK